MDSDSLQNSLEVCHQDRSTDGSRELQSDCQDANIRKVDESIVW